MCTVYKDKTPPEGDGLSVSTMRPHRLLHTMLRVKNLEHSIHFYTLHMGMKLLRREDFPDHKFSLAFLGFGEEQSHSVIELTYNWSQPNYDSGSAYGHLALASQDIYQLCDLLAREGVKVARKPGPMSGDANELIAFIEDPDGYKIELIQKS